MAITTKDLKVKSLEVERSFFFPTLGISILAKSQEEANAKVEQMKKE